MRVSFEGMFAISRNFSGKNGTFLILSVFLMFTFWLLWKKSLLGNFFLRGYQMLEKQKRPNWLKTAIIFVKLALKLEKVGFSRKILPQMIGFDEISNFKILIMISVL